MYSFSVLPQVHVGWAVGPGAFPGTMPMTAMPSAPHLVGAIPTAVQADAAAVPPRGARSRPGGSIDMAEVATALETLYADQLRPYGRILRKRLNELAAAARSKSVDVDIKLLRSSCEACPWLTVQDKDGGDWSVLFRGRPEAFIDVYSPQDIYPAELWRAAAAYFENLDDESMVLPGGRYLCAQVLVARRLHFLAGRSLGEICHIVQLAISQKKLLGYLNGAVVPYKRSQSMVKEHCAERQRPCTAAVKGKSAIATWDTVRSHLQEILKDISPGQDSIPLSNVKRLFRAKFHTELSETALGHSKLSELLQDPRLRDVCSVRLQGQGYVVTPGPAGGNKIQLAASLAPPQHPPKGSSACGSSLRERAKWIQPLSDDVVIPQQYAAPSGADDRSALPAMTPSPSSVRQSLPRLLGRACGPRGAVASGAPNCGEGLLKVPLITAPGAITATPSWIHGTVGTPPAQTPLGLVPSTPESWPVLSLGFSARNASALPSEGLVHPC